MFDYIIKNQFIKCYKIKYLFSPIGYFIHDGYEIMYEHIKQYKNIQKISFILKINEKYFFIILYISQLHIYIIKGVDQINKHYRVIKRQFRKFIKSTMQKHSLTITKEGIIEILNYLLNNNFNILNEIININDSLTYKATNINYIENLNQDKNMVKFAKDYIPCWENSTDVKKIFNEIYTDEILKKLFKEHLPDSKEVNFLGICSGDTTSEKYILNKLIKFGYIIKNILFVDINYQNTNIFWNQKNISEQIEKVQTPYIESSTQKIVNVYLNPLSDFFLKNYLLSQLKITGNIYFAGSFKEANTIYETKLDKLNFCIGIQPQGNDDNFKQFYEQKCLNDYINIWWYDKEHIERVPKDKLTNILAYGYE